MSSLTGSFQACKEGNFSRSVICTGTSCAAIGKIPGMTCTGGASTSMKCNNGVTCADVSNVTSSFSMQGNGLNIAQTHNISIGSQTFALVGTGANFTQTNTTSTTKGLHSAAYPSHELGLKTFLLIAFLLFSTQVYGQDSSDSGLTAIEVQFADSLGGILDSLVSTLCDSVMTTPLDNIEEEVTEELTVILTCFELLMETILDVPSANNSFAGAAAGGTMYGASLPITDATTLFAASLGDAFLCLELAMIMLFEPSGVSPTGICGPIVGTATASALPSAATTDSGSAPTETDSSAATSTIAYMPPSNTNYVAGLPSGYPAISVFTAKGSPGYCTACRFSQWVQGTWYTLSQQCATAEGAYEGASHAQLLITAKELSDYMCELVSADFATMCAGLCARPCAAYSVSALIAGMGAGFVNGTGNPEDGTMPDCSEVQCKGETSAELDGNINACTALNETAGQPSCLCGTGTESCPGFGGICP